MAEVTVFCLDLQPLRAITIVRYYFCGGRLKIYFLFINKGTEDLIVFAIVVDYDIRGI